MNTPFYILEVTDEMDLTAVLWEGSDPREAMQIVQQYDEQSFRNPEAHWSYFEAMDFYLRPAHGPALYYVEDGYTWCLLAPEQAPDAPIFLPSPGLDYK